MADNDDDYEEDYALDEELDLLPDIETYLETFESEESVSCEGQEETIYRICAATGLNYESSSTIFKYLFQEIRNSLLRGEKVIVRGIGSFYLKKTNTDEVKRAFIRFKPNNYILKKINE